MLVGVSCTHGQLLDTITNVTLPNINMNYFFVYDMITRAMKVYRLTIRRGLSIRRGNLQEENLYRLHAEIKHIQRSIELGIPILIEGGEKPAVTESSVQLLARL